MPDMTVSARILVIDDDEEIRSLLRVILAREGFAVDEAKDAATARKKLGTGDDFDLLILDVMMPGEDGLSFCERLRETRDTPILMISARSLSVDRAVCLETGADDYLPKPFERRERIARQSERLLQLAFARLLAGRVVDVIRTRDQRVGSRIPHRHIDAIDDAAQLRPLRLQHAFHPVSEVRRDDFVRIALADGRHAMRVNDAGFHHA